MGENGDKRNKKTERKEIKKRILERRREKVWSNREVNCEVLKRRNSMSFVL